jgi:beta-alanine--pyruvate transaminase
MITCAKGLTNGCVPMGAVLASKKIYDAFMQGPPNAIELFHGYTYSAHPIACAAGLATLDIYQREELLTRAKKTGPVFEKALHELRGLPHVIDIRNYGLVGAIELQPIAATPGARAFSVFLKCFERGLLSAPPATPLPSHRRSSSNPNTSKSCLACCHRRCATARNGDIPHLLVTIAAAY